MIVLYVLCHVVYLTMMRRVLPHSDIQNPASTAQSKKYKLNGVNIIIIIIII